MVMVRFLVVVGILNVHLQLVKLKDFTKDRTFDFHVDENVSHLLAPKAFPSEYFLKEAPKPTSQLSRVAIRPDKKVEKSFFREQHNFLSKWQTVANIPSLLKPLEDPKLSQRHPLSSSLSPRSLSCPSDQFACKDGSGCIPNLAVCLGHKFCDDGSDESESLCLPPCSTDMFACADGSKCIPRSNLCNGFANCGDFSHTWPFQCDNCAADHLFKCQLKNLFSICLNVHYKCDGIIHCGGDSADEKPSECGGCRSDQFTCADDSFCIQKSELCNGERSCLDFSHSLSSQCDSCAADHLFQCKIDGVDVCLNAKFKCDGFKSCDAFSDEFVSQCPGCVADPTKFSCMVGGQMTCLSKELYQCDGRLDTCDDGIDEDPSICDNCNQTGLAMCRDGSICFDIELFACDGNVYCVLPRFSWELWHAM